MTLDPRSIVVFILVDVVAFSISIVFFISKPEVMDETFSHSLLLMNVVHQYKVFIFLIFGIFCRIFLFPCAVSGFFLLTAQGKLLTAHAIGTS